MLIAPKHCQNCDSYSKSDSGVRVPSDMAAALTGTKKFDVIRTGYSK